MNALEATQRFCNSVGMPAPTQMVASTSDDTIQMLALLNQAGRELASRHDWQVITFEGSFTTVATESQGTLASIIGSSQVLKRIVDDTIWNRTTRQPVQGPLSQPVWEGYKALTLTGPFPQYRIRTNAIIFNPVPTAGQSCYFEYVSKCWCTDSTGVTSRVNIAADADLFLLDEELLMAGLEWRWLRKKGLSYAEEYASYEYLVKQAIRNERPLPRLRMDVTTDVFRPGIFVPLGSWPL